MLDIQAVHHILKKYRSSKCKQTVCLHTDLTSALRQLTFSSLKYIVTNSIPRSTFYQHLLIFLFLGWPHEMASTFIFFAYPEHIGRGYFAGLRVELFQTPTLTLTQTLTLLQVLTKCHSEVSELIVSEKNRLEKLINQCAAMAPPV
jgi:hypothetical protein